MPKAVELLRQGRNEELWQMCCGFLSLNTGEFMDIQERLLLEQLELLNNCPLGKKLMRGQSPKTLQEFRQKVPLTDYKDYCPELLEKRENMLPARPALWVHSSGRSGEYPYKWVPWSEEFAGELSIILYGLGLLSSSHGPGDTTHIPERPRILYSVAPRPYVSGSFADVLRLQTPVDYMPTLEKAEALTFEDRVKLGFKQALSEGMDYFFGLSLVLVTVGERFRQSSTKMDIRPLLSHPMALLRLARGLARHKLAKRPMLPKDLWKVRGIISSGLDSWVYRDKIKEFWGKCPLDVYMSTEGGVIATQTWDYDSMTFVPNLNFLEFMPEEEHFKWQLDHSYQPKMLLLDEVKAGENYEIVISSFHGGVMVRYRAGDMVRITSLRNERLGIEIPQMVFERRADDLLEFIFVRLTEKTIWQAIENTGVPYTDWIAYKKAGQPVLRICLELKDSYQASEADIAKSIYQQITKPSDETRLLIPEEYAVMMDFKVEVTLLPLGTFANFTAQRLAEGADLAHLKPPHINPSDKVLSSLLGEAEEIVIVKKTGARTGTSTASETEDETVNV